MSLAGLRIGLLTASASRLGGGVSEAVVRQAELIRDLGGDARVFALADRHSAEDRARFGAAPVTTCPVRGPAQIGYSPALFDALMADDLDCLHLHGIWMYPSRAGSLWARRTGRAYLISPHGMLDPWITARGRWKKALARWGYERASWRVARAFHALTHREAQDIAHESGRADAFVIPNPAPPAAFASTSVGARSPRLAYLGRIHPKKNVVALVEAWGRARLPGDARLAIAGWGDPQDIAALEAAVAKAPATVEFLGPVFGDAKADLLRTARFTILPSHSEGLPMAILESWAAGTPAIMTPDCNLPEGFAAGAALKCGHDPAAIAQVLERAFALGPAEWGQMSQAARDLAQGPFSARRVAEQWCEAYRGAIADGQAGVVASSA